MNIFLWVLQVLLGLLFMLHGQMLLRNSAPPGPRMDWVRAMSPALRQFAGAAEALAGIGLILPALTNIRPWLTPVAAAGLVMIMLGAIVFHLPRREYPNIAFNAILLVLAAVVAYGRLAIAPL